MIKILSTEQVREADRVTIEREPIESVDLMERAAGECVTWLMSRYGKEHPIVVFAGVGNNGGDALVMSRRLQDAGYRVETFVVRYSENFSADLQINLDRLEKAGYEIQYIFEESQFPSISSETVIIDGLFGSGLNRPVADLAALCIDQINASIAEVISIDMPSGLFADQATVDTSSVILASHTLTFQVPKLAFFIPGNEEFTGDWSVVDIGLDASFLADAESDFSYVDSISEHASFLTRSTFDHKGVFGHGLLIAGAHGKMGAATMSAKAALRSGIGRLTVHIPHSGNGIMQVSVPEAMTSVDDYDEFVGELPSLSGYSAVGLGPGIGKAKKTRRLLKDTLILSKAPIVLDADALNLLGANKEMLKLLPENTILTPHIAEFNRMFGSEKDPFKRIEKLRQQAKQYKVIIVLKGAFTAIASPQGKVYFNSTGNPGMATAGSGDVLTGIITGLVSQIKDPLIAAICGVYVHGVAGDLAAMKHGMHGMIASDIVEAIGPAIDQSMFAS